MCTINRLPHYAAELQGSGDASDYTCGAWFASRDTFYQQATKRISLFGYLMGDNAIGDLMNAAENLLGARVKKGAGAHAD